MGDFPNTNITTTKYVTDAEGSREKLALPERSLGVDASKGFRVGEGGFSRGVLKAESVLGTCLCRGRKNKLLELEGWQ